MRSSVSTSIHPHAVPGDSPSDPVARLLVGVAAREQNAFADLYLETSGYVLAVIRRQLVDPSMSDEVRQEVFLEVWQLAGRFSPAKGSGLGWISVIARRRAVDRVRAVHASRLRDLRAAARDWVPTIDVAGEREDVLSDHRQVLAAMGTLTPLERQAVELVYRTGKSSVEAAGFLRVTPNTFRTRLRAGLRRLRAALT